VDLANPREAEEETLLISLLDYHPLAIENCQTGKEEESHLPKVKDYDDYLFIIFNPVECITTSENSQQKLEIKTSRVSAFL
jgi:magnesium transporter